MYLEWSELGISIGSFLLVAFGLVYNRKNAKDIKKGYKPLLGSIGMRGLGPIGPALLNDTDSTYVSIPSQMPAANSTRQDNGGDSSPPPPPPPPAPSIDTSGQPRKENMKNSATPPPPTQSTARNENWGAFVPPPCGTQRPGQSKGSTIPPPPGFRYY